MASTADKVIDLIADQLNYDKEKINRDTDIANDLGADSLDIAELMIALEEQFDINIDENDAQNVTTVGQVIDYIDSALTKESN